MISVFFVLATVVASIYAFYNAPFWQKCLFNPYMIEQKKEYWRFISHGFIHQDWTHLLLNMLVLWSFGSNVEFYYNSYFNENGTLYFISLYLLSIVASSARAFYKHRNSYHYNSLGASGATSAVLMASVLFNPMGKVYVYFLPMPSIVMGVLYLWYESYMAKRGGDNIAHDAHFDGAIFGIIYTLLLKPSIALHFIQQLPF